MTPLFPARALDLPHPRASEDALASRSLRKRLTLHFPQLTDESRFSRGGEYETILTPWGEVVVVFGLLFLALAAVYLGRHWREVSAWTESLAQGLRLKPAAGKGNWILRSENSANVFALPCWREGQR